MWLGIHIVQNDSGWSAGYNIFCCFVGVVIIEDHLDTRGLLAIPAPDLAHRNILVHHVVDPALRAIVMILLRQIRGITQGNIIIYVG